MSHNSVKLENGLRVVTVELPYLHSVELAVYIKAGSRNDPWKRSGLSHFLEHMLFRGTEDYASALEIETAFEELGGSVNAATDADSTCYYARIHPAHVEQGLSILASMLLRPKLEGIELERGIIGEEALEDINESGVITNPDLVMGNLLWPGHPLGCATVGSLEDIKLITDSDLRNHLFNWYSPANAVVVVSGPVVAASVATAVNRHFGGWQMRPVPPTLVAPAGVCDGPAAAFVQDADSQVTVQLAFHSYRRDDPRITPLKVLRRILAGGGCSRLHLALRERLGLVYAVDSAIGAYDETGCITIDFSTAPENLPKVLSATLNELHLLMTETAPERELERVRTAYLADLDYSRDSVSEMCARYGWGTLMQVVRSIDEDQKLVSEVTPELLAKTAQELFRADNRFMAVIGPVGGIDQQETLKMLRT